MDGLLLQKPEKEAAGQKKAENFIRMDRIAPYVRYVNYKIFEGGTLLPERIIYDHELIYCLSGEAVFLYNGSEYRLRKGELFYLMPYLHNTMIVPEGKTFRAHCIHFDWISPEEQYDFRAEQVYLHMENLPGTDSPAPALYKKPHSTPGKNEDSAPANEEVLLRRPNPEVDPAFFPPLITGLDYDTTAPVFKELYQNYSQLGTGARLRERSLFLQIAAAVCDLSSPAGKAPSGLFHEKNISESVNYIQEYYTEDISLPLLASHSGLSPKYFGQLFKEQTGMAVREYLTEVRIRNARHLLSHTDNTLEQIAADTGFQDKFYFTKVFKRQTGITPGKYRKLYGHLDRMKKGELALS